MPRHVWTGIIMLENPKVMLLQIRYNNRLDNFVTSAECQLAVQTRKNRGLFGKDQARDFEVNILTTANVVSDLTSNVGSHQQ